MARSNTDSGGTSNKYNHLYAVDFGSERVMRSESSKFVLGRSETADLFVCSPKVSDKHCEISCSGDDWILHNLSPDGTSLVGRGVARNEPVKLGAETIFKIGGVYVQCKPEIESKNPLLRVLKLSVLMGERCRLTAESEDHPDGNQPSAESSDGLENAQGDSIEVDPPDGMDSSAVRNPASVVADEMTGEINGIINNMASVHQQLEEELRETKEALKLSRSEESNWKDIAAAFQQQIEDEAATLNELMENELQCSICNELIIDAVTLDCSHTYCGLCLSEWKKNEAICPLCRKGIVYECKTRMIDSLIEKVIGRLPGDARQRRKELCESRRGGRR